ncbi:MAG: hypothetical protein ACE5I3_00855 [Phycisphaerae bacterium]
MPKSDSLILLDEYEFCLSYLERTAENRLERLDHGPSGGGARAERRPELPK